MHVSLLAWALWAVATTPRRDLPDTPPVEVAIITPSELTRLKQGDPTSKELAAKAEEEPDKDISKHEAKKPKPVVAAEPPPAAPPEPPKAEPPKPEPPKVEPPKPEPEKKAEPEKQPDPIAEKLAALPPPPEPAPGPTPEELKKQEEQKQAEEAANKAAEEKKKAEDKKKAEEKKKAEILKKKLAEQKRKEEEAKKKKQEFDPDRIAALLDKTPDKKGAPQKSNSPDPNATHKGPTAGNPTGNDTVLSAREVDALNGMLGAQLRRCYQLPGGGGGSNIPIVELRWRLKPDGMLDGQPEVINGGSGALAQVAVDTAIRAVIQCQPFNLPPDKYRVWKLIERAFDPSNML